MSGGSKKLRPVERLTQQRQERAAVELAKARSELQESQGQLENILHMRQDYRRRLVCEGTIEASRLRDFHAFLCRLDEAVDQQRQGISDQQQRVEQLHKQWLGRWAEHRRIESVVERRAQQERQEQERREQRELDETARLLFQAAQRGIASDSE
ncbi:flagellar export protein FliJ [Halorhodospira halochloris]|uniref:Flagellar FliJ protein n=1 Tax=Halorhodospira halochloris TaxID=1052 RepID=A0A0X8XBJ4_HALHR|nr:flagellar export protein FliJ [Halorhodospira halochloris]MBK1651816.1 flagellar export protein FliJ [Halorhodospira halochloris]MCG5529994.1 flagellar export protein FliJ [Halorhodospira halochloris]MCG5548267.1 flagellar export protein FliJ [Halorhodospira halochloris]BAU58849.1 flagellar protein FliJ [Halorhodospira halochloris]